MTSSNPDVIRDMITTITITVVFIVGITALQVVSDFAAKAYTVSTIEIFMPGLVAVAVGAVLIVLGPPTAVLVVGVKRRVDSAKQYPLTAFDTIRFTDVETTAFDKPCVVCNQSTNARIQYGRKRVVGGFVTTQTIEGTVAECSDCRDADWFEHAFRWDTHEMPEPEVAE